MTDIQPGWYKDPADPSTQRYWDGEGWLGDAISADVDPPAGPPAAPPALAPVAPLKPVDPLKPAEPVATPAAEAPPATPASPLKTLPPGAQHLPAPPFGLGKLPLNPPAGFVVAAPGTRAAARIVDILAILVLAGAANAVFGYRWWQLFWSYVEQVNRIGPQSASAMPAVPPELTNLGLIILFVTTAVWFAYEVPSTANSGQTIGKRLLGIRVMRMESVDRLGFGRSWRRWSRLGLPTLLWWCCGIGLIIQLLDCFSVAVDLPLHQALHDKAAATVVVRTNRTPKNPAPVSVGGKDDRSDSSQS